ncbi:hypothetical protein FRC07_013577, partial [Ceratobasidium sp. 392]
DLQKKCSTTRTDKHTYTILEEICQELSQPLPTIESQFTQARSALAEYAVKKDPALLPKYLEAHPVLLQLVGSNFFNSFEFLRYVHGGPAGAKSAVLQKKALAVVSAAVGMGIFVNQLQKQVMLPLMTEHIRARYILDAAVSVEHFAPSIIDGRNESTWWMNNVPHAVALDAGEDLPRAVQDQAAALIQQRTSDQNIDQTLDVEDPSDITLTGPPLQEDWHEDLDLHMALPLSEAPAQSPGHINTSSPASATAVLQDTPNQTVFALQDPEVHAMWVNRGRIVDRMDEPILRWDRILSHLPSFVSYPGNPSAKILHHLQGADIALFFNDPRPDYVLQTIAFGTERLAALLNGIFKEQSRMRLQIQDLIRLAITQQNICDFIVIVLAPSLVRLKENHVVQLARIFVDTYELSVEEAQAESLYLALSNRFWEKDILFVDDDNNMWIDYQCTMSRLGQALLGETRQMVCNIGQRYLGDHQLSAMFLDGCGAGLSEQSIQHNLKVAQVLQAAQTWNFPARRMTFINNKQWNTRPPATQDPLHLDHARYDDPGYLRENGWELADRKEFFTTWHRGSSLSTGVFVDWGCMRTAASTRSAAWEQISSALKVYESHAKTVWVPLIQAERREMEQIVSSVFNSGLVPQSTAHNVLSQHAESYAHEPLSVPLRASQSDQDLRTAWAQSQSSADEISNWTTQPEGHLPFNQQQAPTSDRITSSWGSTSHNTHGGVTLYGAESAHTQEIFQPGTPSDEGENLEPQALPPSPQHDTQGLDSSDLPSRVEATPQPDYVPSPSLGDPEEHVPLSSQPPFMMETGIKNLQILEFNDSDDPDTTWAALAAHPRPPYPATRGLTHPGPNVEGTANPTTQQSSINEDEFVIETGFTGVAMRDLYDSDDPDHQPPAVVDPDITSTPADTPVPGPSTKGRKRAATKTSPQAQLYKRTARG